MSWRSREISGRSVAEQWEVEGDGGRSIRLPPTAAVASAAASAAVLNSDAICACTRMLDAALRAVWKGRVGLRVVEGRRQTPPPSLLTCSVAKSSARARSAASAMATCRSIFECSEST